MKRDMHTLRDLIQRAANGIPPTSQELGDPTMRYHWYLAHNGGFLEDGALTVDGLEFVRLTGDADRFDAAVATLKLIGTGGGPWDVLKELLERGRTHAD